MNSPTSICSAASVDSASPLKPKDSEPLDSVRLIPTPPPFSESTGQKSEIMETCEMFPTEDVTSSPEAFLANRFRKFGELAGPGARQITAISGRQCLTLLRAGGRLGCLARTLMESSMWHSTRAYLIWKPLVTTANRLLFRLVPLTQRT